MDEKEKGVIQVSNDPLIAILSRYVVWSVKLLAVMMVIVIYWSMLDVVYHVYAQISLGTASFFNVNTLITTLGSFLAVLIAIEIFLNIIFYLKRDAVHVPLVLSTAVTAVARKVIIIDYSTANYLDLFALAAVIFALGLTYWLVAKEITAESR